MSFWPRLVAPLVTLAALPTAALDDHFDASKYEKGGFARVTNDDYAKECGGCHFAYLPGMLPARSWQALLRQETHFGESLSLAAGVKAELEAYLTANAADRSDYDGSRVILSRLPESATPLRVTQLPLMRQYHSVVTSFMESVPVKLKGGLSNCDACHGDASSGDFGVRKFRVPAAAHGPDAT